MNLTDTINGAGQSTPFIDETIKDLKARLAALALNCITKPDPQFISDSIKYVKTKIIDLTREVNLFSSSLQPISDCGGMICTNNYLLNNRECFCYCRLDCDTKISIFNWNYCQCSAYTHANMIYEMKYDIQDFITKVQNNVESTTVVHEYLEKLYDVLDNVETALSNMEHNFDTIDLDYYTKLIQDYFTTFKNIQTDYNDWFTKNVRCSSNDCGPKKVVKKDCTCYQSPDTDTYFTIVDTFEILEGEILGYSGPGNPAEVQVFDDRTLAIRQKIQDLYSYWVNNDSYDQATVDAMLNEIIADTQKLRVDWDNFVIDNSPTCTAKKLKCNTLETAINLRDCECSPLDKYKELQESTAVLNQLQNKIDSMTNPNKGKLQQNL